MTPMKHLPTLVILVLSVLSAQAQYRYNLYTVHSGATNLYVAANSASTNTAVTVDVGGGDYVQFQLAFSLISTNTNAIPSNATNLVTCVFDSSMDGTLFTNETTFAVRASTTNSVWGITNFAMTWPWVRYLRMTNDNPAHVTNFTVKIGQKIGL